MTDREVMQQALEALTYVTRHFTRAPSTLKDSDARAMGHEAIAALRAALAESDRDWSLLEATQESLRDHMAEIQRLRAALAEPVQEPVAWLDEEINCAYTPEELDGGTADGLVPLYTAPPQRKPLNEDQMNEAYIYIWRNLPDGFDHTASAWIETAIRYAERAHGIIATEVNGDKDGSQG